MLAARGRAMGFARCVCFLFACFTCTRSQVALTQSPAVVKAPGDSHKLSCSASGFSLDSNHIHWLKQVPGQGMEWLLAYRKPTDTNYFAHGVQARIAPSRTPTVSSITISGLKVEDTAIYYCARGGYLDYWGQGTMVTVTAAAAPSAPTLYAVLSSCGQASSDDSLIYGCLAADYLPEAISLSWRKDEEPIAAGFKTYPSVLNAEGKYTLSSQLTITWSELGGGTVYCLVQHYGSERSVNMPGSMVYHPTVLLAVSPTGQIASSRLATAVCSITDFHPKSLAVTWLRNGRTLASGFATSPAFETNGNFSAISRLAVPAQEWFDGSTYTCRVSHYGATRSGNISRSAGHDSCSDPVITIARPPLEQVLLEAAVTLTCLVSQAPYGVNVSWRQGRQLLTSGVTLQPGPVADSVVSNLTIATQAWLSGDSFTCLVSHEEMPTPRRASIQKEKAPDPREPLISILLPSPEDMSPQRPVTLTCFVRGFSPREILVKWAVNGQPVGTGIYSHTEVRPENGNGSFFVYSLLSVGAEEWNSGASYTCVVGHEALPLKLASKTVNKSSGKPTFVNVSLVLMDTVNSCQ